MMMKQELQMGAEYAALAWMASAAHQAADEA
jgi:hypothetical protein